MERVRLVMWSLARMCVSLHSHQTCTSLFLVPPILRHFRVHRTTYIVGPLWKRKRYAYEFTNCVHVSLQLPLNTYMMMHSVVVNINFHVIHDVQTLTHEWMESCWDMFYDVIHIVGYLNKHRMHLWTERCVRRTEPQRIDRSTRSSQYWHSLCLVCVLFPFSTQRC